MRACHIWRVNNREHSTGLTDWVFTILALGELNYDNGPPALGSEEIKHTLESGEVLNFVGNLKQTYSSRGEGTFIWFH